MGETSNRGFGMITQHTGNAFDLESNTLYREVRRTTIGTKLSIVYQPICPACDDEIALGSLRAECVECHTETHRQCKGKCLHLWKMQAKVHESLGLAKEIAKDGTE